MGISDTYVSYAGTAYENVVDFGIEYANRLAGIVANPNTLGMASIISIMMSVLIFKQYKPRLWTRIFLIASIIVNILCLVLASARGPLISLLAFSCVVAFCALRTKIKEKQNVALKYTAICVLCIIVSMGIYAAFNPLKEGIGYTYAHVRSFLIQPTEHPEGDIDDSDSLDFQNIGRDFTKETKGANGRFSIWRSGLRVVKEHPIFGVGMVYKMDYVYASNYENDMQEDVPNLHNVYIETAVAYGIPSLLVLLVLLSLVGWRGVVLIIRNSQIDFMIVGMFALYIAVLISNLVEARMLYDRGFLECNYSLVFGYLMYYLQIEHLYRENILERAIGKITNRHG